VPPPPPESPPVDNPLARLEARLQDASRAAERLIAQAAAEATAAATGRSGRPTPPPQGWQTPAEPDAGGPAPEIEALVELWTAMRELVPPELRRRVAEAVRELLTAMRELIDWYLERADHDRRQSPEVEDIPIL
jgi:hypothetical protein